MMAFVEGWVPYTGSNPETKVYEGIYLPAKRVQIGDIIEVINWWPGKVSYGRVIDFFKGEGPAVIITYECLSTGRQMKKMSSRFFVVTQIIG